MPAKPSRSAASTTAVTATSSVAHASAPSTVTVSRTALLHSSPSLACPRPTSSNLIEAAPGPPPASGWPDPAAEHRPSQPFPGAAPSHQDQQSTNLHGGQSNQSSYQVPGVFNSQSGLQSPFHGNPSHFQSQQPPPETAYYGSNPSPRSTSSTNYYTSDKSDPMAAATATMQRPYPPIYHTPQSNSPASVTSPQNVESVRPIFQQQPSPLPHTMYAYPAYQPMAQIHQPVYGGHQAPSSMNSQSMLSYSSNGPPMHPQLSSQSGPVQSSPRVKDEQVRQYSQTPQAHTSLLQRHPSTTVASNHSLSLPPNPTPPATSNAAPGPIPATTPLVVRHDGNGVQWIAFEYSRDRVKLEYTIRCDVESVDHHKLGQEFKNENCVYPRACVPKDQYKGNRLSYETECNQVGWALAELNPCLRGKRGLIQRAVDSWRNSNRDPRLRSRRVRRQAKMSTRSKINAPTSQGLGPGGVLPPGLPSSSPMGAPGLRSLNTMPSSQQIHHHHHHNQHNMSPSGQEALGTSAYSNAAGTQKPNSTAQHLSSPAELRHAHTFPNYQPYPTATTTMGPSMAPPIHSSMQQYGRPSGSGGMAWDDNRYHGHDHDNLDFATPVTASKRGRSTLSTYTAGEAKFPPDLALDPVDVSATPASYWPGHLGFSSTYMALQRPWATASLDSRQDAAEGVDETEHTEPLAQRLTIPSQRAEFDNLVEVAPPSPQQRAPKTTFDGLDHRVAWGPSRGSKGRPGFLGRGWGVEA